MRLDRTSLLIILNSAVLASCASGGKLVTQGNKSVPAPQPTINLIAATPAPPESLQNQNLSFNAELTFSEGRKRFSADFLSAVKERIRGFANRSPRAKTSLRPVPVSTLSPSENLKDAAESFREVNAARSTLPKGRPSSGHLLTPSIIVTPRSTKTSGGMRLTHAAAAGPDRYYSGRGFSIDDRIGRIVATYANQSVDPFLRFSPKSDSFLYAPTLLGSNGACIEVVTAYSRGPAAVWAWDWCDKNANNPARAYVVDAAFIQKYVRDLGSGIPEYTVQTSRLPKSKTWVAKLFDYRSNRWDQIYHSSGDSLTKQGTRGWDFFEEHAVLAGDQVEYCPLLSSPFESVDVQVSSDGTTFAKLESPAASPLIDYDLSCAKMRYRVPNSLWHWTMQT